MTDAFDHPEDAIGGHSDRLGIAGHDCDYEAHSNPYCTCNTTDDERGDMLDEYVDRLTGEFGEKPQLMPLNGETKRPVIEGRCYLDTEEGRSLLVEPDEAVRQIREEGARGFAIYAGKPSHNTEHLALVDHDDTEAFPAPTGDPTLEVLTGSARGVHETYRNNPADPVRRAIVGDGLGEIKAKNWFCLTPGSVHPSGGVYHIIGDREIATISDADLTDEMRPNGSTGSPGDNTSEDEFDFAAEDIDALPDDFDANAVENDVGVSLATVRGISEKLDRLLNPPTTGYPSSSEADQACVSSLLYWRFEETDIADIFRAYRSRQKLNRDKYVADTIRNTSLTEASPFDPDLLVAIAENASKQNGQSIVSAYVLEQIRFVLHYEGEATVREIVDTGLIDWWAATNVHSVERRVRRGLKVLEDAGYVSSIPDPRDRRATLWRDEGLNELTLPEDW